MNIEIPPNGVVIEVGANNGSTFYEMVNKRPDVIFFGFEPVVEMHDKLSAVFQKNRNYLAYRCAVGTNRGVRRFYVSGTHDWGCSSFLEFSPGLDHTWPGREDFVVTEVADVLVVRLDEFIKSWSAIIKNVDFLHIDAQGTDLDVLKSAGDCLSMIRAGVMEVPQSDAVALYKNQHTRKQALDFLEEKGFKVSAIEHQQNEDNIFFTR